MKCAKSFIVIILVTFILTSCSSPVLTVVNNNMLPEATPTEAASKNSPIPTPLISEKTLTENQIAHEAYENAMREGEGQFYEIREFAEKYSFYDIDDDGIDELIAYPGFGVCTYIIYNFSKGNINELMSIGQAWDSLTIYPEKSAFSFIGTGHMGYYLDVFYKLSNGKAYIAAEHDYNEVYDSYDDDRKLIGYDESYTVGDKEATEAMYTEFTKSFATGKQVNHEDLQWYQWVNPEDPENAESPVSDTSTVLQSNETETHYFRFDSNTDDSIIFRFKVNSSFAKLQNMNITLCDSDLKPVSKTDSFGAFEQMDYECAISEEGMYYLKVFSEFNKVNNDDFLDYKVFILTP